MGVDSKRKDGNYLLTTCISFTPTSKSPNSIDLLADFGDRAHIISATLKRVAGAYHMLNEMPSRSFTPPKVVSNPESLHWHVILSFIISKFTVFDVGYGDKGKVASKFGDSSEHFGVSLSLEKRGDEWEISKETHEERALNFTCDKLENPEAVLEGTRCLAAVVSGLTDAYEVFDEVPTRRWVYSDVNPKGVAAWMFMWASLVWKLLLILSRGRCFLICVTGTLMSMVAKSCNEKLSWMIFLCSTLCPGQQEPIRIAKVNIFKGITLPDASKFGKVFGGQFVEVGGVKLREDIRNAHGYTFLVQFALTLSSLPQNQDTESINSISPSNEQYTSEGSHALQDVVNQESIGKEDPLLQNLSPTLSRLFDVFVNLAQTGQTKSIGSKSSHTKASGHSRSRPPSIDRPYFSRKKAQKCRQNLQGDSGHNDESSLSVFIKELTYLLRLMTAGVADNAAIISSQTFYELLSESGLLCVEFEKQVIQLLLELALEIVLPPFLTSEHGTPSDVIEIESSCFLLTTPSGLFNPGKERVHNAGAVRVLIRSLLLFTPKVQLEVLNLIDKLARAGLFNQENFTSVGCVELLLETIRPFLLGSSPLLSHALKIVEVLGGI